MGKTIVTEIHNEKIDENFNIVARYLEEMDVKSKLARTFKIVPCPETDPEKKAEMERTAIVNCLLETIQREEEVHDAFAAFASEVAIEAFLPFVAPTKEDIENADAEEAKDKIRKAAADLMADFLEYLFSDNESDEK